MFLLGLALLWPWSGTALASTRSGLDGYTLTRWDIEDGLPHNLPLALAQDARGRIWISTWEGVARFNGHAFTVFDRRSTGGIDLGGSGSLLPEPDGSMLVGNARGVFRYADGGWSLLDPRLDGVAAEVMLRARDGTLWVASGTRLVGLGRDGRLRPVELGGGPVQVFGLAEMPNGRLVLGTENGLYGLLGNRLEPLARGQGMDGAAVLAIQPDGAGWLLSTTRGLWRLDDTGRVHPLGVEERVDRSVRGHDGLLWLNFHDRELAARDAAGRQTAFPIPGLRARALLVDRNGALWGGSSQGLYRIARGAARTLPDSAGYIRAVMEDARGTLWLGHSGGLRRLAGGQAREVLEGSVLALAPAVDGNGVWAGTYDQGVVRVDAGGRILRRVGLPNQRTAGLIRSVRETADGSLWIGTGAMGLLRWHAGRLETVDTGPGLSARRILALVPDGGDGLWIGTEAGMLRRRPDGQLERWRAGQELPAAQVFDFLPDPDGTVWIASDRGLLRLRGGHFAVFDGSTGLPREKLFRILDDGQYLWLSSTRGVFRVARAELERTAAGHRQRLSVAVVDHTDGMPGGQGNGGSWPAGWRTADGRLLFPTADGVGWIDADGVAGRHSLPVPVELERVLLDGAAVHPQQALAVGAGTRRVLFAFTGLAYQAPERVRYRYRLAGFDAGWTEAGNIGQAMYTNLPPGDYRFEMEAMSLPVDWRDRARVGRQALAVRVDAPLWQQPLAVAVGVGSVLVLAYGLMGWRMTTYRRRQRRLDRLIAERTDELVEKNFALEAAGRERDALLQQLAYQATHDALTELPNRRAADEHLRQVLRQAQARNRPLAVAMVDLDHFKQVNDSLGHDAGDHVLAEVGRRLRNMGGGPVFAARHGGEEFLLVVEGWPPETVRGWLEELRQRLAAEPVRLADGRTLTCTFSAGLACLPADGTTANALLSAADARLYEAKRAGRNRLVG